MQGSFRLAFSDKYLYELPEGHRFPIIKYELVKEQLLYEGVVEKSQLIDPGLASDEDILLVHQPEYWDEVSSLKLSEKDRRKIGLPLTELSVNRARNSVAGTIAAAGWALEAGLGINLAGGTHHAYAGHGEGFSVLNDIAIASMSLLQKGKVQQVLVVDLDVHQGNGTAHIFQNELQVFTFSIHGKDNYPLKKENSDLDLALPTGTGDDRYLDVLDYQLNKILRKVQPDIVFYQAGVDVLATDKLGKLALTKNGCRQRDDLVFRCCIRNNLPVVVTMGGGYSERVADVVDAHCHTIKSALSFFG
ncbi:histone deacetylase [Roseivirga sp. BDSF3-8]|uniref:histone deacetylase family protein n=1 Tax=Roseivirga sp. BDSF3-8 TaxID=3241598 RepID=UPI0035325DC1